LEWDAARNTLYVTPQLPAQWNEAQISRVPIGNSYADLSLTRDGITLVVRLTGDGANAITLASHAKGARMGTGELLIPLSAVEVGIGSGLPAAGAVTSQMKVLDQKQSPRSLQLTLAALAGGDESLFVRVNDRKIRLRVDGAKLLADSTRLDIQFPSGNGYVQKVVTLSW
jgi:hypothetical protein